MSLYIYIYIYMHVYIYVYNASCLINTASFVVCAVYSVKDHHSLRD